MKTDHFCPRVGHHVGVPDQTLHSVHNLDYAVDFEDIGSHGTLLCEEMWSIHVSIKPHQMKELD